MCGIVAYIGPKKTASILLQGLRRLEYRGYDSAGLAILSKDAFYLQKEVGRDRRRDGTLWKGEEGLRRAWKRSALVGCAGRDW